MKQLERKEMNAVRGGVNKRSKLMGPLKHYLQNNNS